MALCVGKRENPQQSWQVLYGRHSLIMIVIIIFIAMLPLEVIFLLINKDAIDIVSKSIRRVPIYLD